MDFALLHFKLPYVNNAIDNGHLCGDNCADDLIRKRKHFIIFIYYA